MKIRLKTIVVANSAAPLYMSPRERLIPVNPVSLNKLGTVKPNANTATQIDEKNPMSDTHNGMTTGLFITQLPVVPLVCEPNTANPSRIAL